LAGHLACSQVEANRGVAAAALEEGRPRRTTPTAARKTRESVPRVNAVRRGQRRARNLKPHPARRRAQSESPVPRRETPGRDAKPTLSQTWTRSLLRSSSTPEPSDPLCSVVTSDKKRCRDRRELANNSTAETGLPTRERDGEHPGRGGDLQAASTAPSTTGRQGTEET
jgi:hypothetical protein